MCQIFLACASIDFVALMDQTSLAGSLTMVGDALNAGSERAWIAGSYFVYVLPRVPDCVSSPKAPRAFIPLLTADG